MNSQDCQGDYSWMNPDQRVIYMLANSLAKMARGEISPSEALNDASEGMQWLMMMAHKKTHEYKPEMNGSELITAERKRQIEGWTVDHEEDAGHEPGTLAQAAYCYLKRSVDDLKFGDVGKRQTPYEWPWDEKWWRPTPWNHIVQLTKAGALIAAELDRLIHEKAKAEKPMMSICGNCEADLTDKERVCREYISKDGHSSVFSYGHYDQEGNFVPDKEADLSRGRYDLADDSDTCDACGSKI